MAAEVHEYQFQYTDVDGGSIHMFQLGSISEDVAKGIRFGLRKVPSITQVVVQQILVDRQALSAGDPTP